jgi:hypothetical protein
MGVAKEQLQEIDMLPKIKNKLFLTPELAPTFAAKEDDHDIWICNYCGLRGSIHLIKNHIPTCPKNKDKEDKDTTAKGQSTFGLVSRNFVFVDTM